MKNKIKIFRTILVAIGASFLLTTKAQAWGVLDIVGNSVGNFAAGLVSFFSYALLSIIGLIITVVASGTNYILKMNMEVLTNPTVQIGWTICRDIANLGFVLVLIIIALATVLRFQSYGYQKLLIKLIAAAIIVNFSLTIAGFILDFTNVVASFFINKAFGNLGDIASGLANVFQPQLFLNSVSNVTTTGGIDFLINSIMHMTTGAIFSLLTLIILICFMILFLIRYVFLVILLVVSPIAWLMWTLPDTQSLYKKWWTKFLHWCFFAPACLFFLYLAMIGFSPLGRTPQINNQPGAVTAIESRTGLTAQISGNASPGSGSSQTSSQTSSGVESNSIVGDIFDNIINIIVFGGLMVGGLLAANSFGLEGAKAVVGAGTGASKALGKWGGRMALKYPGLGTGKLIGAGINKLPDTGIRGKIKGGFNVGVAASRKVTAPIGKAADAVLGKAEPTGKNSLLNSVWAATKKGSGLFGELEKNKKKGAAAEMEEEAKGKDKEGQEKIKQGNAMLAKLDLIKNAIDLEAKAKEANRGGDQTLAVQIQAQADALKKEYEEFIGARKRDGETEVETIKRIKEESSISIETGEGLKREAVEIRERRRDVLADLAEMKRKEDVHKEAEKLSKEHGGSEHKEESHPEPAKSGGEKSGHGSGH